MLPCFFLFVFLPCNKFLPCRINFGTATKVVLRCRKSSTLLFSFAVKPTSWQIAPSRGEANKKKNLIDVAETEVQCILGFGHSWSLTLPFSTRMIMIKRRVCVLLCTCVRTRYADLQCVCPPAPKAACLVLLLILQLQRLARPRISATGYARKIYIFQWI